MSESFGARMRQRREEYGVALASIAERTKIKLSLLEALERDDVSHWPAGIFRRAYFRAYAQAIGLDPEAVLREFLELYPDPAEVCLPEPEAAHAGRPGGPPIRLSYIVGAAIGTLTRFRPATVSEDTAPPALKSGPPLERHEKPDLNDGIVATTGSPVSEPPADGRSPIQIAPQADPAKEVSEGPVVPPEDSESVPVSPGLDITALADLCTALGCADNADQIPPVLREAARILDATGIIVWIPDATGKELRPALAHGYSDRVLAYLPSVWTDADNATATAFREERPCVISGNDHQNGALVLPLLTAAGCSGVLALELRTHAERNESVRACATVLAALLAQLTCPVQDARRHGHLASSTENGPMSVVRLRVSAAG